MPHDLDASIWDFNIPHGCKRLIRKLQVNSLRELAAKSRQNILLIDSCGSVVAEKTIKWLSTLQLELSPDSSPPPTPMENAFHFLRREILDLVERMDGNPASAFFWLNTSMGAVSVEKWVRKVLLIADDISTGNEIKQDLMLAAVAKAGLLDV